MQTTKCHNYTFEAELGKKYSVKTERIIAHLPGGVLTRGSSYGAEILCTFDMPIIDVDFKGKGRRTHFSEAKELKMRCREFVREQKEDYDMKVNLNLYRTKKGARIIISGQHEWDDMWDAVTVMESFQADDVYIMLCEQQQCYRARLTPKPMRVGFKRKTPFNVRKSPAGDGEFVIGEDRAERWINIYNQVISEYRTCYLVGRYGGHPELESFSKLLDLHDKSTGISKHGLPLA